MSDPIAAIHKIQQDEYSRVPLSAYQLFVRKPRGERDAPDDITPVRIH